MCLCNLVCVCLCVRACLFAGLVAAGTIVPRAEPPAPKIPMDFNWAKRLGLIRKPANFISSISDDRGDELLYAGMPISEGTWRA